MGELGFGKVRASITLSPPFEGRLPITITEGRDGGAAGIGLTRWHAVVVGFRRVSDAREEWFSPLYRWVRAAARKHGACV